MPTPQQRSTATRAYHPRLAVVFDFDKTLAPGTLAALVRRCGVKEPEEFRQQCIKSCPADEWDDLLAEFHALVRLSRDPDRPTITRDLLQEVGRGLELFPGVPELFDRIRGWAREIVDELEVEFYVLTCGLVQMHRAHPVAGEFKELWGSEFAFGDKGEIVCARKIVTFSEKARYLMQLSRGLGTRGANSPSDVYRAVPDHEIHVPFSQMLYVGDGGSDMPAFSLMNERGGLAIGVVQDGEVRNWSGYSEMHRGRRVQNLAPADYREGSELLESIRLSVEAVCKLIALRRLSAGE